MDNIKKYFSDISEIARYLWERGWAEKNAGNFSINVTGDIKTNIPVIKNYPFKSFDKPYQNLKNNSLLISSAGSKMRYIAKEPFKYVLLVQFSDSGKEYGCFSFNKFGRIIEQSSSPTSEFQTHLEYQNLLAGTSPRCKAILHSHPPEIIALTHKDKFTNEKYLNKVLFKMHPEVKMYIPEGAGLVPFIEAGTNEIAEATVNSAKTHRVIIWEKHGCFAAEETISDAFDLIDIVSKSAQIYFLSKTSKSKYKDVTKN